MVQGVILKCDPGILNIVSSGPVQLNDYGHKNWKKKIALTLKDKKEDNRKLGCAEPQLSTP